MQVDDDTEQQDVNEGSVNVCRGFVAAATASFKLFGQHPYYGEEMRRIQDEVKAEAKEPAGSVLTRGNFVDYHTL